MEVSTREIIDPSDGVWCPAGQRKADSGVWDALREENREGLSLFSTVLATDKTNSGKTTAAHIATSASWTIKPSVSSPHQSARLC